MDDHRSRSQKKKGLEKRSGRMRRLGRKEQGLGRKRRSNRGYLFGMSVGVVRRNEFVDMNRGRGN